MKNSINLALDWLSKSDIRHREGIARGGVNQGYNWQERSYPFVYSEITGYAVSMFVNAYRWTEQERYLTLAQEAAEFLLALQYVAKDEAQGAIAHGFSLPLFKLRHQYYSFDGAMCLQGLLDLYAIQPTAKLELAAQAMGDWLIYEMQKPSGAFLAMYNAETGESKHLGNNFFDDFGCLHAKHAIGLLKLAQVTKEECYTSAAERVCDWVLGLQDEDGAFRANGRSKEVVSHPHCYATEGLLFAHYILKSERYLEAARRAGEWLLSVQNSDGSINIAYKRQLWRMKRRLNELFFPKGVTDATAQASRIWLILYYLDQDQRFFDAAQKAGNFLEQMQETTSSDPNAKGGFYFWPEHPIMFTWATMFALNALYALEHRERKSAYHQMIKELF